MNWFTVISRSKASKTCSGLSKFLSISSRLLAAAICTAQSVDSILPSIPSTTYCPRMSLFTRDTLKTNTSMAPMISTLKNDMIPITRQVIRCDSLPFFITRRKKCVTAWSHLCNCLICTYRLFIREREIKVRHVSNIVHCR